MMGLFREVNSEQPSQPVNSAPGVFTNSSYRNDNHYEIERKYLDETKVDTVISFFKYGKRLQFLYLVLWDLFWGFY